MPIWQDCAEALKPDGSGLGPVWGVRCEAVDCGRRTYLFADDAKTAGQRAEADYGWRIDGKKIWCEVHRVGSGRGD